MAGPACKAIINSGRDALSSALERILTNPNLHGGKIDDTERREMIQQMAEIDRVAYHGGTVEVALGDIMVRLEEIGVLSADVWDLYAEPAARSISAGSRKEKKEKKGEGAGGGNGKGD